MPDEQQLEVAKIEHEQWLNQSHTQFVLKELLKRCSESYDRAANHAICNEKYLAIVGILIGYTQKQIVGEITNVDKFISRSFK